MAVAVFAVNEGIVVLKILIARIIRRVNVDYVHLARVGVVQDGEGVEVIAFDEGVLGGL